MEGGLISLHLDNLDRKNISDYDLEYNLVNLEEILKILIIDFSNIKNITLQRYIQGDIINFIPLHENIREGEISYSQIFENVELQNLYGYKLISIHPLAEYVIKKLGVENTKSIPSKTLTLNLLKITTNDSLKIWELIGNIDEEINGLVNKNYIYFSTDEILSQYLPDLCYAFGIKIIENYDMDKFILQIKPEKFYKFSSISPEKWLLTNLSLIKEGYFSECTIGGDWMFDYSNRDYIRLYGELFAKTKLKYMATLAYSYLLDQFNFSKDYIFQISVNDDLSINVYLPDYNTVKIFLQHLYGYLENRNIYIVETYKTISESIVRRYALQKMDPDTLPILFFEEGDKILVYNGIAFLSQNLNYDKLLTEKELGEKFLNFYGQFKICHNNIEPISLEKISQLDLDSLISLIPVTENNITYCYNSDNLGKIGFNPLTREKLSSETQSYIKYMQMAWNGYFSLPPNQTPILYGLFDHFPINPHKNIDFGEINLIRLNTNVYSIKNTLFDNENYNINIRKLVGNLFSVRVILSEGKNTLELFQISLPTIELDKIDKIKIFVEKLWHTGFFLSDWSKFHTDGSLILNRDQILSNAKNSIADGNTAFGYLQQISTSISI